MIKPISIEDCRRVFVATMKRVYQMDRADSHTYSLVKSRERTKLDDNSGDVIVVPTRLFNKALADIVRNLGLHAESVNGFKNMFGELAWILRPREKNHQYKRTLSEPKHFHGKSVSCYSIDRIKFDVLAGLNGVVAKTKDNRTVEVAVRNADGDVWIQDGNTQPTTVTCGLVQDSRYNRLSAYLDAEIEKKEQYGG